MCPLVNRLEPGDSVDASIDGVVWWSATYLSLNKDGKFKVQINRTKHIVDVPYDMIRPTQETITKHQEVNSEVPSIESEDDNSV